MNSNLRNLISKDRGLYISLIVVFAFATAFFGHAIRHNLLLILAALELASAVILTVCFTVSEKRRRKSLEEYIDSIAYSSENAKDSTILNFPLPMGVFRLEDTHIIWGNDMLFSICGGAAQKYDARFSDFIPEFSSKWLRDGHTEYPTLLEINGRKFRVHGNIIRPVAGEDSSAFMGLTYWIDVTDYDNIRLEYENSRPVAGIIVVDNLDELFKNQPERIRNDIRESIEDRFNEWASGFKGIVRRYDRDRYIAFFEKRNLEKMKEDRFGFIQSMHSVENPSGMGASISVGFGEDAATFAESLQFAELAIELALTRGGDQAVIKNRLNFEFYGGRGLEVEKRTKVRSRVMANTLAELIKDSSKIMVMGHRYADFDCIGAAAGICCMARKCGVKGYIVVDEENNASASLINVLKEDDEYRSSFISPQEAMLRSDGRTLLVVVDTNRPEQVEDPDLLSACNRVAVIDHHRVSSTYIGNAVLGFIEPYASSTCELVSEMIQELTSEEDILRCEAEAVLTGIVLDTKNFTIRTGERTFEAAAFLRHSGADTTDVKKMLQTDMDDTVRKYGILQLAKMYRGTAIAAPETPQNRVTAAQAADELLNISGVEASFVIAPGEDGRIFTSARSIGELNVQIICEKLGGGGNRGAAAAVFKETDFSVAVGMLYKAIDEYMD